MVEGLNRDELGNQNTTQADERSALPPPEPRDRPGTRPKLNLDVVRDQIRVIQEKLAAERRARKAG